MTSELKNPPTSPINGIGKVKIFDTISTRLIIDFYRRQENLDVAEYFAGLDEIFILECEDTGYRFYYPFEVIGDEKFYRTLQMQKESEGLEYDRNSAEDHKFAVEQIEQNTRLLEIGCGTGKFLELISDKTENVCGLELNARAAETATKKGFDVKNQLIQDFAEEQSASFDVVCAFQVLEHIAEVKSFLEACLKLLKPNGKLIFSVPNNEPYFQKFSKYEVLNLPPHHLGLWNLEAFRNLEKFFAVELSKYEYQGQTEIKGQSYLHSKFLMDIKTLPNQHTFEDKVKIYSILPYTIFKSSIDYLKGNNGYAIICVVFQKI